MHLYYSDRVKFYASSIIEHKNYFVKCLLLLRACLTFIVGALTVIYKTNKCLKFSCCILTPHLKGEEYNVLSLKSRLTQCMHDTAAM